MPPFISFVVLNYNNGRYLLNCLDSIFAQAGQYDFEVILVDDASTDDSLALVRACLDPRLRIITHLQNQGHIATVHDGLRAAVGQYIARIDSDDRYRPNFLCEVIPLFEKYPEVGLVYGDAALIDDQGQLNAPQSDSVHGQRDFKGSEFLHLLQTNFVCAPTVIARREAWLGTIPVPTGLAFHDWYFTTSIARHYEFYFRSQVLADYRVHQGNMHTRIARDKTEESSIFRLLDRIFSEPESSPDRDAEKHSAKGVIYGTHYLTLANKYFWLNMNTDARRCYWLALQYQPQYLLRPDILRRFTATLLGRAIYERAKLATKPILGQ